MPLQCDKRKAVVMEIVKEPVLIRGREKYAWNLGTVSHQEGIAGLAMCPTFVAQFRVVFLCSSSNGMTFDVIFLCNSSPRCLESFSHVIRDQSLLLTVRDWHKTEEIHSVLFGNISRGFSSPILEEAVKFVKCQ